MCPDTVYAKRSDGVSYTVHVGISKALLLELLSLHGAGEVLVGWAGTDDEAREAINADRRAFFVMSPECPKQNDDGSCACAGDVWGKTLHKGGLS